MGDDCIPEGVPQEICLRTVETPAVDTVLDVTVTYDTTRPEGENCVPEGENCVHVSPYSQWNIIFKVGNVALCSHFHMSAITNTHTCRFQPDHNTSHYHCN